MKLIEYVNGSRQALYHGTFLDVAMEIVKDGYISSETQQQINNKTVYGVSLSRNPNVSYKFGNIIFKINPLALNQKKLIPYNWVHLNPKEKMSPREEAEEFYIDDIIINSKIISIIYILKINPRYGKDIEDFFNENIEQFINLLKTKNIQYKDFSYKLNPSNYELHTGQIINKKEEE